MPPQSDRLVVETKEIPDKRHVARYLTVTHIPKEGDESHSGIGGCGADEMGLVAADLLAEKVNAVSCGLRSPPMTS